MNTGLFDAVDLGDGSGKFPLQSPLVVELLHELSHAEVLAVENFKANAAALRKAFGGHCKTQFVDLVGRNQNTLSICGDLVGGFGVLQFFDNFTCIFSSE